MSGSIFADFRASFFVWVTLVLLWLLPPFVSAFHGLVKVQDMRTPYAVAFLLLMFPLAFLLCAIKGKGAAAVAVRLMAGCIGGYLCSIVAIVASNDVANGWGATARAASQFGWEDVISTNAWAAFILCGWLLGIFAAVLAGLVKRLGSAS